MPTVTHRTDVDLPQDAEVPPPRRWPGIALLVGLAITLVLLCGGLVHSLRPHVTDDPAAVAPLMEQLLTVNVPPVFAPRGTIEWNVAFTMSMRGAYYDYAPYGVTSAEALADKTDGELAFVGVDHRFQDKPDVRQHIEQVLRQRGAGTQELALESVESRMVPINGEPYPFEFETRSAPAGRSKPKVSYRLIHGVVNGRSGPVLIVLRVPLDGNWNDAIAEQMLGSIR